MDGARDSWELLNCEAVVENCFVGELIARPVLIGALLGWITNHHQEYLYRKAARRFGGKPPPEARLYHAAVGGIAFPVGMFIFAWTGKPSIPWIVPILALCLSNWGIYCMYGGVL